MDLQDFLQQKFKSWQPSAPLVINRTKGHITLTWIQEEFKFLEEHLLYRVEKNNKLPKWVVVYSGGKTSKLIDHLAPSHPHRFRLKVILKATAVQHLAEKALGYYGDEKTVREKLGDSYNKYEDLNSSDVAEVIGGRGDNAANITFNIEEYDNSTGKEKQNEVNIEEVKSKDYVLEAGVKQRWAESAYSEETWTSTDTEGTSAVCFCMAVKCGYIKQVQSMFEERPALLSIVNASSGFTPLATAVKRGDVNTVSFLVSLGAEVDQPSSAGQTPLHLAVLSGDVALAELLLDNGADFHVRDWNGLRVEHYAVDSCSLQMLRLILDRGGDVTARDYTGWTPLFRALCQGAKTEIVEELIIRGSDLNAVDNAGLPLASAAKLLKNRHGRSRDSILRLADSAYPHEKALANFTRITKKVYNVNTIVRKS